MGRDLRVAARPMIRMFDRTRRLRLLLALLVTASLAIVTIDFRTTGDGPLDKLGRFAVAVLGPVQEGLVRVVRPVGSFFAGFTQVGSLRSRVSDLERDKAALLAQQEQVSDIARENASLRRLLGLRDRLNLRTKAAQVIAVSPSNFERTVTIDRGSEDGIRRNMPVIGGEGLAGRVIRVGPSTAVVMLVTDRGSAVAGRLASSGETGVLEGAGAGRLRFELFDPDARLRVGDKVLTSGHNRGLYPSGIPVGTVVSVEAPGGDLSRRALVEPFVDFSSLDYVLVVFGQRGSRP